jgi:hypothetical protein
MIPIHFTLFTHCFSLRSKGVQKRAFKGQRCPIDFLLAHLLREAKNSA